MSELNAMRYMDVCNDDDVVVCRLNEIITNDIQDGTTRCFIGWFTRGWGAGGREVTVGRSGRRGRSSRSCTVVGVGGHWCTRTAACLPTCRCPSRGSCRSPKTLRTVATRTRANGRKSTSATTRGLTLGMRSTCRSSLASRRWPGNRKRSPLTLRAASRTSLLPLPPPSKSPSGETTQALATKTQREHGSKDRPAALKRPQTSGSAASRPQRRRAVTGPCRRRPPRVQPKWTRCTKPTRVDAATRQNFKTTAVPPKHSHRRRINVLPRKNFCPR